MKRTILGLLCLMAFLLPACAGKEPVQKMLDDYNMTAIEPPRNDMTLGELYIQPNLTRPIIFPGSVDGNSIDRVMTECGRDASLHDISFDRTFKLNAEAALIGSTAAVLASQGATSYSVTFCNPKHFTLPLHTLASNILPTFDDLTQSLIVGETYYIASLLRVDGMEYTFKDNSGAAVDLGQTLGEVAAKLNAEISAVKQSTLVFNSPRFIGFSMNKLIITESGEGEETILLADIEGRIIRVVRRTATDPADAAGESEAVIATVVEPQADIHAQREAEGAVMAGTATVAFRNYVMEAQEVPQEELTQSQQAATAQ